MRFIALLLLSCIIQGYAVAQSSHQADTNQDSLYQAKADSINKVAANPDFVHVSLLWVSAGSKVYTASGHSALRLQCPSNNLDIVYTFEMDTSIGGIMRFFNGTAPAGFVSAPTQLFLDSYKGEGRGVKALKLNLSPREEQNLWKYLDTEFEKGAYRYFDYEHNGCSAMTVHALGQCLDNGSQIEFRDLDDFKAYSYREVLPDLFRLSPWVHLFWNTIMGTDGEESKPFEGKLYPSVLFRASRDAVIIDSLGHERQLTVGRWYEMQAVTVADAPFPVTPAITFGLLCILAVIVTVAERKRGYGMLSRCVDIILLSIQTILGVVLCYMLLFSQQAGTSWNWLVIPFNPLPLIMWLTIRRRRRAYMRCCTVMAATLFAFMLCYPLLPQMHNNALMLICMALFVRIASVAFPLYSQRNNTNNHITTKSKRQLS